MKAQRSAPAGQSWSPSKARECVKRLLARELRAGRRGGSYPNFPLINLLRAALVEDVTGDTPEGMRALTDKIARAR